MKKIIIAAMLMVISVSFAVDTHTNATPEAEQPKAKLELRETKFDFGIAPDGQRMTHHFLLRSVGEDPLLINSVRATCGCTSAPVEKDSLTPGDSTFLKVTFNSSGYRGRKARKHVRINSNNAGRSIQNVGFSAFCDTSKYTVIKPDPVVIDVGSGEDFMDENKFMVKNITEDQTIELKVVTYDFDHIEEVKIKNDKLKPGKDTEVIVKMKEPVDGERILSSVTIEASDEAKSRITIPIRGGRNITRRHPRRQSNNPNK
ncbi:MAG: DUF1573 domain-containing protein [Candidatus Zixiibacteriota bacterium]